MKACVLTHVEKTEGRVSVCDVMEFEVEDLSPALGAASACRSPRPLFFSLNEKVLLKACSNEGEG